MTATRPGLTGTTTAPFAIASDGGRADSRQRAPHADAAARPR